MTAITGPARQLALWLSRRSGEFPRWAAETGIPTSWDFSEYSLTDLQELLLRSFTTSEEVEEHRLGPFLQGAAWYTGEVACRSTGVVWRYEPVQDPGEPRPEMFAGSLAGEATDTPCLGPSIDGTDDRVCPLRAIYRLFLPQEQHQRALDQYLDGVLDDCGRYEQLAVWLHAQASGFADWSEELRLGAELDFSPESLDLLEVFLLAEYRDEAEFESDRNSCFVQGAVWYLGEVMRRNVEDTWWGFDPIGIDPVPSVFAGRPDDVFATPYVQDRNFPERSKLYPVEHLAQRFSDAVNDEGYRESLFWAALDALP